MSTADPVPPAPAGTSGVRAVLAIGVFRRFWLALGAASLADWVGLLALTAFANALAGSDYADKNFAIGGVLFLRVVPALLIGPFGGYVADRLDRRTTLVIGLFARAALFASIPLVGTLGGCSPPLSSSRPSTPCGCRPRTRLSPPWSSPNSWTTPTGSTSPRPTARRYRRRWCSLH
ncbi:MAG: hypothetical protein WKF83_17540 [Nocardioidaceae bacterium]